MWGPGKGVVFIPQSGIFENVSGLLVYFIDFNVFKFTCNTGAIQRSWDMGTEQ